MRVMRIRDSDPGWKKIGSRIRDGKKSRILDPEKHPGSATLVALFEKIYNGEN